MTTFYPTIRFKRLDPEAPTPKYVHEGDAGMDLCSMDAVDIAPQGMVKVHSGLAMAIPRGYYGMIVPRSGIATKRGITIANDPGIIDSGYRGEVIIALYNQSTEMQSVERLERVCQLIIHRVAEASMVEVDSLDETERGTGGFGSTGTRL